MKIIQLEKSMDVISNNAGDEMYFLRRTLITHRGKSKPGNHNLFSTRVYSIALSDLSHYLTDPDVILVKVDYGL